MKALNLRMAAILALVALHPLMGSSTSAQQDQNCRTFTETGMVVCNQFLDYWNEHGGLAQYGYPISNTLDEVSIVDGYIYNVQYFERAVFEQHAENTAPNNVLLSLLGVSQYKQKYPNGAGSASHSDQMPNNSEGSVAFPETGKRLGGWFLDHWRTYGGLAQYGFPISDEFVETSDLNGKTYLVQYFQRAVFELHTENQPPYNVLLSQLGLYRKTTITKAISKMTGAAQYDLREDITKKVCYYAILTEQADTSNDIKDWNEKGQYVVNKLKEVADRTQPPVVALLKKQQTIGNVESFTSFYIFNGLVVRGNLTSAIEVASLSEVGKIVECGTIVLHSS